MESPLPAGEYRGSGQHINEASKKIKPKHEGNGMAHRLPHFLAAKQRATSAHHGDQPEDDGGSGQPFQDPMALCLVRWR